MPGLASIPPSDVPGTVTTFETAPLGAAVDYTDDAYLGNRAPNVLIVAIDPTHPGTLHLPVVAPGAETQGARSTPTR